MLEKNKTRRWLLTTATLATLLIGLLLWSDQSLNPEVRKALDFKPAPLTEAQKRALDFVKSFADRKSVWSQEDPQALGRYIQLMEFGEGGHEPITSTDDLANPVPMVPDRIHLAFIAQLSAWMKQGGIVRVLDLLELSNRYYSGFLKTGSLSDRATALDNLLLNARLIGDELPNYPKIKIPETLVDSFSSIDVVELIYGGIQDELRTIDAVGRSWRLIRKLDGRLLSPLMFRRRQTLNQFYEIAAQQLNSDCQAITAENELTCAPAMAWLHESGWWNSAGRRLIRSMGLDLVSHRRDLEMKVLEILEIKKNLARRI